MESSLYRILVKQNSWWIKGRIDNPKATLPKRDIFERLTFHLTKSRILAVIGPRRTGKTVALFQLVKFLLQDKKISPENVCYVLCDDPEVELYLIDHKLGDIIEGFLEGKKGEVYLLLDEIQYLTNWAKWLKKYHEFYPQLKLIITGSSALYLAHGSKESLIGRLVEEKLLPLTFPEYIRIKGELSNLAVDLSEIGENIFERIDYLLSHSSEAYDRERFLKPFWQDFLLYGGFPEGLTQKDITLWQEYLKEDIVKRQIYHDIVKLFKIENPSLLENLLFFIGANQGQLFSWESFLKALPFGSKETVVNYLSYLKETFLVFSLPKFSKKALIKQKKYFLTDSGLTNMITGRNSLLGEETFLGHLVEGVVANFSISRQETFFFRDDKAREVDLITKEESGLIIPIEVKYKEKIAKDDLLSLTYFAKKHGLKKALVLTKKILNRQRVGDIDLYFVPVQEYLWVLTI